MTDNHPNNLQQYQSAYLQNYQRAMQDMSPKIGAGHAAAMGRMGLDEISHALKAFPDSIPITPEPGAFGEPTPQEVFANKLSDYQVEIAPEQSQQQQKGMEP